MRVALYCLLWATALAAAPTALAADDEIDLLEDDEDLPEPEIPTAPAPVPAPDDEDIDLESGEEVLEQPVGEGQDNATIYRDWQARVAGLEADEEVQEWETYLEKYPQTAFRTRIEERIEALMDELYGERIVEEEEEAPIDADLLELPLAQSLLLENINPRSHVTFGFEYGLPTWLNLYGAGEYAIFRNFSVGGGVRRRYTGWSVEAGVKYAPIKSLRTGTVVTLIGDVRFNAIPAFAGLRPQVGVGQILFERMHLQLQVGADIELRRFAGVHLIGGANATFLLSPTVALFLEGATDLKHLTWKDGGVFAFSTATFGIKFFPKVGRRDPGDLEVNVGGTLPFATNYWSYHFGSVMGQVNYYLPEN